MPSYVIPHIAPLFLIRTMSHTLRDEASPTVMPTENKPLLASKDDEAFDALMQRLSVGPPTESAIEAAVAESKALSSSVAGPLLDALRRDIFGFVLVRASLDNMKDAPHATIARSLTRIEGSHTVVGSLVRSELASITQAPAENTLPPSFLGREGRLRRNLPAAERKTVWLEHAVAAAEACAGDATPGYESVLPYSAVLRRAAVASSDVAAAGAVALAAAASRWASPIHAWFDALASAAPTPVVAADLVPRDADAALIATTPAGLVSLARAAAAAHPASPRVACAWIGAVELAGLATVALGTAVVGRVACGVAPWSLLPPTPPHAAPLAADAAGAAAATAAPSPSALDCSLDDGCDALTTRARAAWDLSGSSAGGPTAFPLEVWVAARFGDYVVDGAATPVGPLPSVASDAPAADGPLVTMVKGVMEIAAIASRVPAGMAAKGLTKRDTRGGPAQHGTAAEAAAAAAAASATADPDLHAFPLFAAAAVARRAVAVSAALRAAGATQSTPTDAQHATLVRLRDHTVAACVDAVADVPPAVAVAFAAALAAVCGGAGGVAAALREGGVGPDAAAWAAVTAPPLSVADATAAVAAVSDQLDIRAGSPVGGPEGAAVAESPPATAVATDDGPTQRVRAVATTIMVCDAVPSMAAAIFAATVTVAAGPCRMLASAAAARVCDAVGAAAAPAATGRGRGRAGAAVAAGVPSAAAEGPDPTRNSRSVFIMNIPVGATDAEVIKWFDAPPHGYVAIAAQGDADAAGADAAMATAPVGLSGSGGLTVKEVRLRHGAGGVTVGSGFVEFYTERQRDCAIAYDKTYMRGEQVRVSKADDPLRRKPLEPDRSEAATAMGLTRAPHVRGQGASPQEGRGRGGLDTRGGRGQGGRGRGRFGPQTQPAAVPPPTVAPTTVQRPHQQMSSAQMRAMLFGKIPGALTPAQEAVATPAPAAPPQNSQ